MKHDIVIIGGGISGVSTAYELARRGFKPLVLERSSLAAMASGWTLGGGRQSGRHPAELPLALAAVQRWPGLAEELDGETGYRQGGNLRIARTPDEAPRIQEVVEATRAAGIDIDYLPTVDDVRKIAPVISPGIHSASLCHTDGHAEPVATVTAFARAAERLGVEIRTGVEVTGLSSTGGKIDAVRTVDGVIPADTVVVAAGIYTPALVGPLEVDVPITVTLTNVYQTVSLEPQLDQVIGVATGNLAFRQQIDGKFRLTGANTVWEHDLQSIQTSHDSVQPVLANLVRLHGVAIEVLPSFEMMRINRVWGGLIDQSPDGLPVYSADTGVEGLVVAAGFSGHGFGIGPVTGQILADLATGETPPFDLDPFRIQRFTSMETRAPVELHG
ncbi:MAG: FAD-binding oxidoreductase [Thermomicrobiales bacterium]|nr:FAD-binding oxidoreductase [Thermomicrobiales bacterium]